MTFSALLDTLVSSLSSVGVKIITFIPRLLTAVIVLVIGWLVARLVRIIIVRLVRRLDNLWNKLIVRKEVSDAQKRYPPTKILGEISFWLVILFFLSLAADIIGLKAFVSWISQVVSFFPLLVTGIIIIVAGIILSSLVRDLVTGAASSVGTAQAELLGRISQVIILITSIVIGVDQIGIDITFLSIMAAISLATSLGALALAFGLGSKQHVANIIASNNLRKHYHTGDSVRLVGIEGKIVTIGSSRVIIDTAEGQVSVPAFLFDSEVAVLTEREE
jgi:hypothetical protein